MKKSTNPEKFGSENTRSRGNWPDMVRESQIREQHRLAYLQNWENSENQWVSIRRVNRTDWWKEWNKKVPTIFAGDGQGGDGTTVVGDLDLHGPIVEFKELWLLFWICHGIQIFVYTDLENQRGREWDTRGFRERERGRVFGVDTQQKNRILMAVWRVLPNPSGKKLW